MATYKVIQDIEAEDKFLGPLTLKQFVFASISAVMLYLSFIFVTKNLLFLLVLTVPPALLGAFLAVPWSKDQPTEVWVLAKLRFYLKPKKRIWDQSGVKELVTITVPKKVEKHLTKEFDQREVHNRLKALAETIDSRGWAIKNSSMSVASAPVNFQGPGDRLIDPRALPQPVPDFSAEGVRDVMEAVDNPLSDNFSQMMQASARQRRDQALEKMEQIRRGVPLEAIDQPTVRITPPPTSAGATTATPPADDDQDAQLDERQLSARLKQTSQAGDEVYNHLRTVSTAGSPRPVVDRGTHESKAPIGKSTSVMTTPVTPDILGLAHNDDLSVETIARQANKPSGKLPVEGSGSEVVISLH